MFFSITSTSYAYKAAMLVLVDVREEVSRCRSLQWGIVHTKFQKSGSVSLIPVHETWVDIHWQLTNRFWRTGVHFAEV